MRRRSFLKSISASIFGVMAAVYCPLSLLKDDEPDEGTIWPIRIDQTWEYLIHDRRRQFVMSI